jgi:hypothetical protein
MQEMDASYGLRDVADVFAAGETTWCKATLCVFQVFVLKYDSNI